MKKDAYSVLGVLVFALGIFYWHWSISEAERKTTRAFYERDINGYVGSWKLTPTTKRTELRLLTGEVYFLRPHDSAGKGAYFNYVVTPGDPIRKQKFKNYFFVKNQKFYFIAE